MSSQDLPPFPPALAMDEPLLLSVLVEQAMKVSVHAVCVSCVSCVCRACRVCRAGR